MYSKILAQILSIAARSEGLLPVANFVFWPIFVADRLPAGNDVGRPVGNFFSFPGVMTWFPLGNNVVNLDPTYERASASFINHSVQGVSGGN